MNKTNFNIRTVLKQAGISYKEFQHEAVYTVDESSAVLPAAFPVKNLFLSEEKGTESVLVVMKGESKLDTKWLARELDLKKLRFAKEEVLLSVLGVKPGSVSLFSILHEHAQGVHLAIDDRILKQTAIGFHPEGDNTQTILVSGSSIMRLLEYTATEYHVLTFPD